LEKVKAVVTEHFGVLKDGVDWPNDKEQKAGEKKHLSAISSILKTLHADSSLMSALESALVKKPGDRGSFDTMAIEQLDNILTSKVTDHETHINNRETVKAQKTADVEAATTNLANCEAGKAASEERLDAAKKAQKEAQTALKDAKKAVDEQDTAVEEAKENASDAESSLEEAKKHVEAFSFLYSRPSKAPEPEPIEVEEEPPAATEEPAAAEPAQ
jgi:DNA repair exonuclease SbcCD ATPase subunit